MKLITKDMILQRMVEQFQKKGKHVQKNGKSIIPQSIDDIPPRLGKHTINGKLNMHRQKAYNQLRYELIDKPKRAKQGRFVHNENTKGKFRTWSKADVEELAMCTSELGYTKGVKKASENLNRTLKSCSMAYSRYFPNASKDDVVDAKPITNSYTEKIARTGRVDAKKPFIARYDNGTVITVHPDTGLITADFKL